MVFYFSTTDSNIIYRAFNKLNPKLWQQKDKFFIASITNLIVGVLLKSVTLVRLKEINQLQITIGKQSCEAETKRSRNGLKNN